MLKRKLLVTQRDRLLAVTAVLCASPYGNQVLASHYVEAVAVAY